MKRKLFVRNKFLIGIAFVTTTLFILLVLRSCSSSQLPKADRNDIGQTVMLSFTQLLAREQYDEKFRPANYPENLVFVYIYHHEKRVGRLAVFQRVAEDPSLCCVTIYEPEWIGGEGLCQSLRGVFQAKIIDRVNITSKEGLNLMGNIASFNLNYDPEVLADIENYKEATTTGTQFFFVKMMIEEPLLEDETKEYWYMLDSVTGITIKHSTQAETDEPFLTSINAFTQIIEKYRLDDALALSR